MAIFKVGNNMYLKLEITEWAFVAITGKLWILPNSGNIQDVQNWQYLYIAIFGNYETGSEQEVSTGI